MEHQDTMETRIHTDRTLRKEEMLFMYAPRAVANPPSTQNFLPQLNCLHHLFHATMAPRIGDVTTCPQYERNLILHYVEKKPFYIFDYILSEIINILVGPLRSCGYAPQIMMMIEKVRSINFVKDAFITDINPQAPTEPTISNDVPYTSAAPSTRSGTTTPPPPTPSTSGGLLRVLKSMFCICQDTQQREDIPLSNQCLQNEKLGIDEFDAFPLVEPSLDEDPFASLTHTDLAAMGAAVTPQNSKFWNVTKIH
jgi:hypothetical protein